MPLRTDHLARCITTLEAALEGLSDHEPGKIAYEIYRAAAVKQFELILEQGGGLLRKRIADWLPSRGAAAALTFKDVFRTAAHHGLIDAEACERWLVHRDSRNETTHEYGEGLAEAALGGLPQFVADARALVKALEERRDG